LSYYDEENNVEQYIKMAEGFNGQKIINQLINYLPSDSLVLELGMGPGTDIPLLETHYKVTGSDYSKIFIDRYRKLHPNAELLVLDAIILETNRKFHGIYSNKVLIHLTREELIQSIRRQAMILKPDGIVCHSFWRGTKEEIHRGLLFTYYEEKELRNLFSENFTILKVQKYQESEPDDSIFLIGRKL
jgi:SAM-dependent methyltransferase